MSKGAPVIAAALAAALYLATAEPGSTVATTPAVTPTDAATAVSPSPVTAAAQEAPSMGAAVAVDLIGEDNRRPALADPVVESIYWRTDFTAAQLEASQRRKPLVRLVTNVATCAPCRQLEAGPLSDQTTIKWLNRNAVMIQRRPRAGESIPFFEVQVRPNVWRRLSIPTFERVRFLNWIREAIQ